MGEHKRRMLAGEPYIADDPELGADHRRATLLLEQFNASGVTEAARHRELLDELLGDLGDGAEIRPPLWCDYGYLITVGARTFVNYGAVFADCARIVIGDDVQIGPNVQLLTPTHPLEAQARRDKWEGAEPITIGDNVWLGGGVIVCPGVTIGADTVVGAGAVVSRDLPPGVLAVGNPARVIRQLDRSEDSRPFPSAHD